MRDLWNAWRRSLVTVLVLLMAVVGAALYVRREQRTLVVQPNLVMLAPRDAESPFFRDSSYVVRLGAHEGARYPMHLRVWHAGFGVLLSERAIQEAIERVVAARRDARIHRVAGGALMPGNAPGVEIALSFWMAGGFSSRVTLRCTWFDGSRADPWLVELPKSENYGGVNAGRDLERVLTGIVQGAIDARCPANRGRAVANAAAAPATEPPRAAGAVTGAAESDRTPASIAPTPDADEASRWAQRDSAALAKAGASNAEVAQLTMATDTLRLRVGEVIDPVPALRLTGVRADGTVAPRFVPLFMVRNPRIAAMGAGGMRGMAAGVTSVVVRAMGGRLSSITSDGASATFVVKVEP